MPSYKAPVRDMQFLIEEFIDIDKLLALPGSDEVTKDLIQPVLEEAGKLNETLLAPLNAIGDKQGCRIENGEVIAPDGFKEAYQEYVDAGWPALSADVEYGGQGFPMAIQALLEEMQCSSNVAFNLYLCLTHGVCIGIEKFATEELKKTYLPKLTTGEWAGVMCLTEAHCGSDLGLLKTKAVPQDDGSYTISGSKTFITSGDHNFSENIIHLVLARTPDAPKGVKGISLFLVPKFKVNADGDIGERNTVFASSLEHKMGIKGSCTCVMNYEDARGYLVGELNQGLIGMFTVMNVERFFIGMQGLGLAEVSYQNAYAYAQERLQGKSVSGAVNPDKKADPIIVHTDIQRMLLTMRSFIEGARAMTVYVAQYIDMAERDSDETSRKNAAEYVALLTPVVKAFFTDYGFDACNLGLQVFGGAGYITEAGMEQFVRDARIAQIYEGTNGIQAMDFVKRKLLLDDGAVAKRFLNEINDFVSSTTIQATDMKSTMLDATKKLQEVCDFLIEECPKQPELLGAIACDYLHFFGLVSLGFMWIKMVVLSEGQQDDFYKHKIQLANFYMKKHMPKCDEKFQTIKNGCALPNALESGFFSLGQ